MTQLEIQSLADEMREHAKTCKPCRRELAVLMRRFQDVRPERMCRELEAKLRIFVKAVIEL